MVEAAGATWQLLEDSLPPLAMRLLCFRHSHVERGPLRSLSSLWLCEEVKVLNEEQKAKYVPEGMSPKDYERLGLLLSADRRPSEALKPQASTAMRLETRQVINQSDTNSSPTAAVPPDGCSIFANAAATGYD